MMFWQTSRGKFKTEVIPGSDYLAQTHAFIRSWLADEDLFTLHTSGSTGIPKPITVTRTQLVSSALMTGEALALGRGTRALVCLNTVYIAGVMMLVRGLELGWEMTIVEPSANPFLQVPADAPSYDFVAMVPMQLDTCLHNSDTRGRIEEVRKILLGGAPVSVGLHEQIRKLPVDVYQSYGMTETVSHVALRRLNGPDEREDYKVLPGIDFGTDQRGCLYFSGAVTNHQKIQTNDLAEIRSDRSFLWLGRADQVINSGGIKIFLDQVDQTMGTVFHKSGLTFPFFSWHEPDEKWGQKLILIVEGEGHDIDLERLKEEIRRNGQGYECPKDIYFAAKFEKTATGKIDKHGTAKLLLRH